MNMNQIKTKKVWVGDPCYIISNSEWAKALDETLYFGLYQSREAMAKNGEVATREKQNGVFNVCGFHCAVSATAHGDGCYEDKRGNEYCVDAGLIGVFILPENFDLSDCAKRGGHVHDVPESYVPKVSYRNGVLDFGFVTINTR